MLNLKTNFSQKFNFFALLIIMIILNSAAEISFAQKKENNKPKWSVGLSVKPTYDDNILKYSDKYLDRFVNNEDEGRFHISSYDDIMVGYSADISFTDTFIGDLKSIIGAGIDYNEYLNNSIKSWFKYEINFRQYIHGSTSFRVSYSFIPKFYIRHFRDDDWTDYYGYIPATFQAYEFSKDSYDFWIQHYLFKPTRLRLYFSYFKYFLDANNTEYDSDDLLYGLRIYQKITNDLSFDVAYRFITSDARGYDSAGETKETSDDVDATFEEHQYAIGIDYDLPEIFNLRNSISLSAQYLRRFYQTDHPLEIDEIHAGRHDYNYRIYLNYEIKVFSNLSVTAFVNWIYRDSDTSAEANREYLSDEKDYNQYQTGLKFSYNFKF